MKSLPITVIAATLSFSSMSYAEQSFVAENKHAFRGYIGPDFKISEMNNEANLLMGVKGGWLINDQFLLGGFVYGTVDEVEEAEENFGYVGVYMDYMFTNRKPVLYHLNLGLGAGALENDDYDDEDDDNKDDEYDRVLVLEPGISAQFSISPYARAELSLTYRLVEGLDHEFISESDLSSPTFGFGVSFGRY